MKKIMYLFLFITTLVSCSESDLLVNKNNGSRAKEISDAQNWYQTNINGSITLKFAEIKTNIEPAWQYSFRRSNKEFKTVETTLKADQQFDIVLYSSKEDSNINDDRYNRSLTRFVLRTDRKTSEQEGFLMTIVPSKSYIDLTDFKPFNKVNYLNIDKNFRGYILYHNLNGDFTDGWVYENGVIVGEYVINVKTNGLRSISGCIPVYGWVYTTDCPHVSYDENGDAIGDRCSRLESWEVIGQRCPSDGGSGGDDGGSGSGGDDGGSSSGNNPGYVRTYKFSEIISSKSLGQASGDFDSVSTSVVASSFYYDLLRDIVGNHGTKVNLYSSTSISFDIMFNVSSSGRATFKRINENSVKELLVYTMQYANSWNDFNSRNAAFEAKVYIDVCNVIACGDCTNRYYLGSEGMDTSFKNDYKAFVDRVGYNWYFEEGDIASFKSLCQRWNVHSSPYNSNYYPYFLMKYLQF